MTQYHDKIHWAIDLFNKKIADGEKAEDNLQLLGYVKKIAADGKIPAWARESLTSEARSAAEAAGFDLHSRMRTRHSS